MKKKLNGYLLLIGILFVSVLSAQEYKYSIDLTAPADQLTVELQVPGLDLETMNFSFPKIIPGTYVIADYGKFVKEVNAFAKNGKKLTVTKINDNQWRIDKTKELVRISYVLEDVFDSKVNHTIYPMAATNFEDGKNFLLNTPGIFGFVEGYNHLPFNLTIKKPAGFYATTSLKSVKSTSTIDEFRLTNVDELYDMPIMYNIPDTATVKVGNMQVVVSVYSPKKTISAKEAAEWLTPLMHATRLYLGGKLPADKYAFIYYFADTSVYSSFPKNLYGALEHTTSSVYYLPDYRTDGLKNMIVDISSHEFFHIISPLTIASKEVKVFNYHEPVMSKHLWLYEGVTEYSAHHVQVRHGMITPESFLSYLAGRIQYSKNFKDTLPFTVMSRESAGIHHDQFSNVYLKGALIGACIDLMLLDLSEGTYGLRNLTHDLGLLYGRTKYFEDDELFGIIEKLTYPQISAFLKKYVDGPTPIPYEKYFALAGIKYTSPAEPNGQHKLELISNPSEKQSLIRSSWLNRKPF